MPWFITLVLGGASQPLSFSIGNSRQISYVIFFPRKKGALGGARNHNSLVAGQLLWGLLSSRVLSVTREQSSFQEGEDHISRGSTPANQVAYIFRIRDPEPNLHVPLASWDGEHPLSNVFFVNLQYKQWFVGRSRSATVRRSFSIF